MVFFDARFATLLHLLSPIPISSRTKNATETQREVLSIEFLFLFCTYSLFASIINHFTLHLIVLVIYSRVNAR